MKWLIKKWMREGAITQRETNMNYCKNMKDKRRNCSASDGSLNRGRRIEGAKRRPRPARALQVRGANPASPLPHSRDAPLMT